jgi:hypothetical protein|tara:strand:+ start:2208 stop:3059 length:852 start_codon:yes stop_codon:yes gene_type:complete
MKFKLWKEYGAMNSKPVFEAFEHSLVRAGHTINSNDSVNDADVNVIWSVLFNGRMSPNKHIWNSCRKKNKPVIVLEVGGIKRGTTWKVGLNGINRDAEFGSNNMDSSRASEQGLLLKPWKSDGQFILICGQHEKSLQWENMPRMSKWLMSIIDEIQSYTDLPIIFRSHPRCRLEYIETQYKNVYRDDPRHIDGTYDDYNLNFNKAYAVVNWSSNPGPQAAIAGVPVFTGPSSLAWPVANKSLSQINNPIKPDRQQWLNDYAWTEFTIEEIASGLPLNRLTKHL